MIYTEKKRSHVTKSINANLLNVVKSNQVINLLNSSRRKMGRLYSGRAVENFWCINLQWEALNLQGEKVPCNRGHDDLYWTVCVAKLASNGDLGYIHSMVDRNKYYPNVVLVAPRMLLLEDSIHCVWEMGNFYQKGRPEHEQTSHWVSLNKQRLEGMLVYRGGNYFKKELQQDPCQFYASIFN